MPRRSHGEGSIRKRPDGRWEARVTTPRGRQSIYGKTRAEVARQLAATVAIGKGKAPAIWLDEYLDDWLETIVRPSVKPRTYIAYEIHIRLHLKPALGRRRLTELDPRDVQQMMAEQLARGLSPTTVRGIRATLRAALHQAERWGLLTTNAAALATPPRLVREHAIPWAPEHAEQFLAHVRGHRLEALYVLALTIGLRQGELLGLRWIDVDLERRQLSIRQTLVLLHGRPTFGTPKTERSRRTLRLPTMAVEALTQHLEVRDVLREAAGDRWKDSGLVFTSSIGTPLNGPRVTHNFKRLMVEAGLEPIRFHDLRHACATFLLAQGVDLQVVRDLLGHTYIATTADLYTHVLASLKDGAADAMDDLFGGRSDPMRDPNGVT